LRLGDDHQQRLQAILQLTTELLHFQEMGAGLLDLTGSMLSRPAFFPRSWIFW
jgi:hypothetical protein